MGRAVISAKGVTIICFSDHRTHMQSPGIPRMVTRSRMRQGEPGLPLGTLTAQDEGASTSSGTASAPVPLSETIIPTHTTGPTTTMSGGVTAGDSSVQSYKCHQMLTCSYQHPPIHSPCLSACRTCRHSGGHPTCTHNHRVSRAPCNRNKHYQVQAITHSKGTRFPL